MSGYHKRNTEPFPVNKLKRVDRPTTIIEGRQSSAGKQSDSGFNKAARGDYGPTLQKGGDKGRSSGPYPLEGAQLRMTGMMRAFVDGVVAQQKAPIPENPQILSKAHKRNWLISCALTRLAFANCHPMLSTPIMSIQTECRWS